MAANPPLSPRRRLVRGLSALVISTVALTLASEVWLRVSGDRQTALEEGIQHIRQRWRILLSSDIFEEVSDPVRRYVPRRGAEVQVEDWVFSIGSHGGRGPDMAPQKAPGERRILCLGDSFAFGMWSTEEETVVGHLARMASAAGDATWTAINLGVPGYHIGQQLAALEQDGLGLDPDLVLLYFNTNDIMREGFFYEPDLRAVRSDHLPLPTGLKRVLWHSHLYGMITRRVGELYTARPSPHLDPDVPWSHVRPENQSYAADCLARIQGLCGERGIPLFVIHQPLMTWSGDARAPDWPVLPLVTWFEGVRETLGIPGISLLGLMRNYADGVDRFPAPPDEDFLIERYFADEDVQAWFRGEASDPPEVPDFHLTGAGYGHIARLAYAAMQTEGMLP